MKQQKVIKLYNELENLGIIIWIDGGWGVDALLDKQTRPHEDLDITMQWKDVPKLREFLTEKGYKQIKEDSKWNFVLADNNGNQIDVHAFVYDNKGNVVDGIMYPAESLTGTGNIDGQIVRCISPKYMVEFLAPWIHKHPDKYMVAVSALCEKFGIELPEEYRHFNKVMLTSNQQKYLQTIPDDKIAVIKPFNPKVRDTAQEIIQQIKKKLPDLEIFFGGASALGIAGQNDIDLNLLSIPENYDKYVPTLTELFGRPTKSNPTLWKWEFQSDGFNVELYLTDRNSPALQEQIKTFQILRDDQIFKKEYEQIKLACNGLLFREYMRKKYEFFNKIKNATVLNTNHTD